MLYFCIIFAYTIGWFFNETVFTKSIKQNFLSVIIAYRNEKENLPVLFKSLENQSYKKENFEIILVNDNSTDNSKLICLEFSEKSDNIFLCDLEGLTGKKNAIKKGILHAKGNLIILTDADCEHKFEWLETINNFYNQSKAKMIIAPVIYKTNPKLFSFENFQALEFLSLIGTTAGSAGINKPIMCNGANLTFEKNIYNSLSDPLNDKITSGDDTFLMLNILKKHPKSIKFLKNPKAIVKTYAQPNLKSFYNQRIRWSSKTKYYKNFNIYFTGISVLLLNIMLFILFILTISGVFSVLKFILLILFKLIIDFPLLFITSKFADNRKLLLLSPFLQLFYFMYITLIGIFSFFSKYNWKNRTV
ncbi:MAG: glycosyltransferase [Bacteroidales bacterium]|nr:glycosyltransferase [Bacteroidales bacterium]